MTLLLPLPRPPPSVHAPLPALASLPPLPLFYLRTVNDIADRQNSMESRINIDFILISYTEHIELHKSGMGYGTIEGKEGRENEARRRGRGEEQRGESPEHDSKINKRLEMRA